MFVNMVSTIDGRAQLGGQHRASSARTADLEMLLELRALADAVLIGTGTLRVEGYARLIGCEERRARRAGGRARRRPARGAALARARPAVGRRPVRGARAARARLHRADAEAGAGRRRAGRGRAARRSRPRPPRSPTCARAASPRCCPRAARRSTRALLGAGLVDELFLTIAPQITGEPEAIRIVEGDGLADAAARPPGVGAARPRRAVPALRAPLRIGSARHADRGSERARRGRRQSGLGAATARRLRRGGARR